MPSAVAAALGVRAEGSRPVLDLLADRIGSCPVLLVLDNFEHVVEAAGDLAKLLAACPRLQLLVTSRTVLHLLGEHEVPLPPLAAPAAEQVFVERATQVRSDVEFDEAALRAVRQIVGRLDGIPLAIELAAARVRLLPPEALVKRLDRRLDLSSQDVDRPARQQTLRATIGWSYALLGRAERALVRRLSVLAGGFSLEAAEAVGAGEPVGDVLETCPPWSGTAWWPPTGGAGGSRASGCSRPSGSSPGSGWTPLATGPPSCPPSPATWRTSLPARRWASGAGPHVAGSAGSTPSSRPSMRGWSGRSPPTTPRWRCASPRRWPATGGTRGLLGQMLDVAERTAALPSAAALAPREGALLTWTRGTIRVALGRAGEAVPLLEEVVAAARAQDEPTVLAPALFSLALVTPIGPEDSGQVRALLEESLALFRQAVDDWGICLALIPLGDLWLLDGDVQAAIPLHEEVLRRAEAVDDDHTRAQAHDQLALDAMLAGDLGAATGHLRAAAALHLALRDHEGMAYCLEGFAALALAGGHAERAARLMGTAEEARRLVGVAVWPFMRPLHARLEAFARAALPEGFDVARAAGRAVEPRAALEEALAALG